MTVAGITLARAPHLLRRLRITREGRHPRTAVERSIVAVDGGAVRHHDAVSVHEEIADGRLSQELVDARHIAALSQPHPARTASEVPLVEIGRYVHLRAQRRPVAIEKWEEGVGRGGGDDFD